MHDTDYTLASAETIPPTPRRRPAPATAIPGDDAPTIPPRPRSGDAPPANARRPGEVLAGRYRVENVLGQGGMGIVYACFDQLAGVPVAVKALPGEVVRNPGEMEEIRDNFQLVCTLRHPHVAGVRTLERDERGEVFLVMDVAAGISLRSWLRARRREGGPSFGEVVRILRQVAAALDYAHGLRVLHRDIKPDNVMIAPDGSVQVLDFGLAAQIRSSLDRVSFEPARTSGTRPYMAPEQWNGLPQREPTDQYALGVLAYEMFSGRLPFVGDDTDILRSAVLHAPVPPIAGLPGGAMAAIRRALAKDPAKRFPSCTAFVAALAGETRGAPAAWGRIAAIAAACAALGAAGFFLVRHFSVPAAAPESEVVPAAPVPAVAAGVLKTAEPEPVQQLEVVAEPEPVEPADPEPTAEPPPEPAEKPKPAVEPARKLPAKPAVPKKPAKEPPPREQPPPPEQPADPEPAAQEPEPAGTPARTVAAAPAGKPSARPVPRGKTAGETRTVKLPGNAKLELVWCPAGTFSMGYPGGKGDFRPRDVTIADGFWLGRTEVTQAQWESVMKRTIGQQRDLGDPTWSLRGTGPDLPVYYVTCEECHDFFRELRAVGIPARLPTPAEWEYACRAGGSGQLGGPNWDLGLHGTRDYLPVGGNPNAWGLCDMQGSAFEWCQDEPSAPPVTLRGYWGQAGRATQGAYRQPAQPGDRRSDYGFRVCVPAAP